MVCSFTLIDMARRRAYLPDVFEFIDAIMCRKAYER